MMLPIVEAEMAVGTRESMMPDKVTTRKKPLRQPYPNAYQCSYPLCNFSWRVWRGDLIEPRA